MKKITYFFIAFIISWHSYGQLFEIATCNGAIASNTYGPMNSTTNSSATNRTATIYPATQLVGISGQELTSIYFSRVTASGSMSGTPNFKIYLKETTAVDFGSSAIDWSTEIATATLVYDSNPSAAVGTNAGWKNFVLATPFTYSGTNNLAVYMEYVNTGNTTTIGWEYEYSNPCISTTNNNTTKYVNNTTGVLGASLATSNYRRPWIAFDYTVSCPALTALNVTNITSNQAEVLWTDTASLWNVQYGPSGFALGSGTTVSTSSNPFTLGSLSPNTSYDVYVQTDCGAGDLSVWVGPINFTTPCLAYTAPWTYDVETAAATTNSTIADCWSSNPTGTTSLFRWNVDASGGTPSGTSTGPSGANSGVKYFYTEASSGATGAVAELYTPLVDLSALADPTLQFYYHMRGVNMGSLHIDVFDGTTWTNDVLVISGQQQTADSDPWTLSIVSLNAFSGSTIQVRFRGIRGAGFESDMSLDDISFEEAPSCFDPINLGATNITSDGFDLLFTDASGGNQFDFAYVVQPQGTGMPTTYPATGVLEDGSNTLDGINYVIPVTALMPNTTYEIYVAADCNGNWVGPFNFTTACSSFTIPYFENFDAYSAGSTTNNNTPDCWSYLENTGGAGYGYISSTTPNSAPRNFYLFNSSDVTGNYMLVSPPTIDLSTGLNRTRFYARAGGANYTVEVGTLSDSSDPSTFTLIQSIPITSTHTQYTVNIPVGTDSYLVFRHGLGGTSRSVYLDDIQVEAIPTTSPDCATNIVATPDVSCGNFANQITWDFTSGADGYYVTIGTTPGGNDVVDAADVNTTSYSFLGTVNTTYYYTITPYNANGSAGGCVEQSFTTVATGCYCDSVPTSNDGSGITNVQIGTTNFPNGDVMYFDHTATPVDLAQGINANVQVSFATGYTYHTNIWIDFNDDYNFDASELVYQGESLNTNPTTLNASFIMPAGAPLGNHRMRIGTADTGQATPNPCYSGSWGVTLDFTVNIVAPSCGPVTFNTPTIVPDCNTSEYTVEIDVLTLGDGTPVLTDGTNTWPINSTGIISAGPYAFTTSVTLSIIHGVDTTCDLSLGSFSYIACPPVNDECDNAIALTVNTDIFCGVVTAGTNVYATASSQIDDVTGTPNNDVWFSFVATNTSHVVSLLNIVAVTGTSVDMGMGVYDATGGCMALTFVADSDPNSLTLNGLTIGNTYLVRVYNWGTVSTNTNNFDICVGTPPTTPPSNDECSGAIALTVNADYDCGVQTPGTVTLATASPVDAAACFGTEDDDVWYSFVATASTHRIQLNNVAGSTTDLYHSLWTGTDCGTLALVTGTCSDPNTSNPTGLVVGQTYYLRVYTWTATTGQTSTFSVCIGTDPALSSNTFDNNNFTAYPNPVKDILNLSYTSEITSVRVINMLGQVVISRNLNATNAQVDMSQLSAGTYIVNVAIGDTIKTVKVVKQ